MSALVPVIWLPDAALSLRVYNQRTEHRMAVNGRERPTRGDDGSTLEENQSSCIPVGTRHRLKNTDSIPLEMAEVQSASCLGEDAGVRLEIDSIRNDGKRMPAKLPT